ncbi:MAG: ABC transporter ATP-binding protein [Desulfovibrionaceae bacterium]
MAVSSMGAHIRLVEVTRKYGDYVANNDISLDIGDGEFFTIVGPSGCGKTTLLRMLVGMDKPTSGDIFLNGELMNNIPANQRPTCMVFQSLALFPHMTVGQNIEFSLRISGATPQFQRETALKYMEMLRLPESYYTRKITECSGGERQRIALARALAFDPKVLFFDEPLSAIDAQLRKILQKELKDIQRKTGKTFVYVTHSLEEAMLMSDRIAIMRKGVLEQVGTPDEIYNAPKNTFVAEFMGEVNLFPVLGQGGDTVVWKDRGQILAAPAAVPAGREMLLMVRPEALQPVRDESLPNRIPATVVNQYSLGSRVQYNLSADGKPLLMESLSEAGSELSGDVTVGWAPADSILLDPPARA